MMISTLLEAETWQDSKLLPELSQRMTPMQLRVLRVTSVLTNFLEQKYGLKLDVQLHDQCMSTASEVEAGLLGIEPHERCLRRKVSLKSRGEVMFDAESVLPLDILPVELMAELEAGKRPLANLLSDRGLLLSRSGLSVTQVKSVGVYQHCWARRSVLHSHSGAKALVTEVFHDAIWRKLDYLVNR